MTSASIAGLTSALDFSSVMRPPVAEQVEPRSSGSKPQLSRPDALELGYKPRK
jgi:hypothetical protein